MIPFKGGTIPGRVCIYPVIPGTRPDRLPSRISPGWTSIPCSPAYARLERLDACLRTVDIRIESQDFTGSKCSEMTDEDTILALNQAFYRAFNDRNLKAMDSLWAQKVPVSCVHPGWIALIGRAAVMASWRDVLSMPQGASLTPRAERLTIFGETAIILCEETLGNSVLVATNLFVREGDGWRMTHHQASPIAQPVERRPEPEAPRHLH